ncbi:MAG: competence/damage-inducible protein A, partial [Staphylococcus sp.]|nr:competence/damage-inducible protein A [Staphylococcus sp.]
QEQVYLGYYDDSVFKYETFKMPLKRNILKSRSQNYAMINLINWFK